MIFAIVATKLIGGKEIRKRKKKKEKKEKKNNNNNNNNNKTTTLDCHVLVSFCLSACNCFVCPVCWRLCYSGIVGAVSGASNKEMKEGRNGDSGGQKHLRDKQKDRQVCFRCGKPGHYAQDPKCPAKGQRVQTATR